MTTGTLLLIDNYDSFADNLARYFRQLGQQVVVVRNDAVDVAVIRRRMPAAIILSPGPRHPIDAGCSVPIVQQISGQVPILGICLGHQAIVAAFGGDVIRAELPMHGCSSLIYHQGREVFANVPSPFSGCRYHSLVADPRTMPRVLRVTATTADQMVMAVQHERHLTIGLQFHPESILTEHGYPLLENFLRLAGFSVAARHRDAASSSPTSCQTVTRPTSLPGHPVTF